MIKMSINRILVFICPTHSLNKIICFVQQLYFDLLLSIQLVSRGQEKFTPKVHVILLMLFPHMIFACWF